MQQRLGARQRRARAHIGALLVVAFVVTGLVQPHHASAQSAAPVELLVPFVGAIVPSPQYPKHPDKAFDFAMDENTAVYAAHAGDAAVSPSAGDCNATVVTTLAGCGLAHGYGNYVEISDKDGTITLYAHLSSFDAENLADGWVDAGERIGWSGNTGYSSGPHLHFEIRSDNTAPTVSGCVNGSLTSFDLDHLRASGEQITNDGYACALAAPLGQLVKTPSSLWQRFDIGGGILYQGAPVALFGPTNNVFAVAGDGSLVQRVKVSADTDWSTDIVLPAGSLTGGVSAVQVGDTVHLFGVRPDGALLQVVKTATGPWQSYEIGGARRYRSGKPAVLWGPTIDVFAVDSDGSLIHNSIVDGTSEWRSVRAPFSSAFAGGLDASYSSTKQSASVQGVNRQVFAVGTSGQLWQVVLHPDGRWSRYDVSGGLQYKGAPTVLWGPVVHVFAIAQSGVLVQRSATRAGWATYELPDAGWFVHGVEAVWAGDVVHVFGS